LHRARRRRARLQHLAGQKNTANQKALTAERATGDGEQQQDDGLRRSLQQYLASGTLPAGYQSQVDQAIEAAKTTAISNAAAQARTPTQHKIPHWRPRWPRSMPRSLPCSRKWRRSCFRLDPALSAPVQGAAGLSGQLYQALVQNDTAAAANTGRRLPRWRRL